MSHFLRKTQESSPMPSLPWLAGSERPEALPFGQSPESQSRLKQELEQVTYCMAAK